MTTIPRPALLSLLGALLALVVAACGSSGDEDANPAAVVPARAPLYLEATVRPEGDLRADFEAAASRILRTEDPSAQIRRLVEGVLLRPNEVSYAQDVKPWLGRRAGVFLTGLAGEEVQGAVVLTTSDTGATIDAIEKGGEDVQDRSVAGTDYRIDRDGTAWAALEDMVVVGTEPAVRAAIEAVEGDRTLEGLDAFTRAREALIADRLALGWVNLGAILDVAAQGPGFPPQARGALRQLLAGQGAEGVALALRADADALRVDVAAPAPPQGGAPDPAAAAQALRSAPRDALAAVGLADVGGQIRRQLGLLGQSGAVPGGNPQALLEGLGRQLGVDVQRDLLAWMGDGVAFARGNGLDLGGALVIRSSDPAATRRGVAGLGRLIEALVEDADVEEADIEGAEGLRVETPGLPRPVFLVASGDRFIAAVGRPSLRAAMRPGPTLGEAESFRQAAAALGDGLQPSLYVDVSAAADAISALTGAGEDPGTAQALRFLDVFTGLVAGSRQDGEIRRSRLALGLR